jgi:hypothetical protein
MLLDLIHACSRTQTPQPPNKTTVLVRSCVMGRGHELRMAANASVAVPQMDPEWRSASEERGTIELPGPIRPGEAATARASQP